MLDRLFEHDDLNYEIELPEDPATWTEQMNSLLFTKFPELVNFPAKLMLDKFEPQKLYAKGSYLLDINGSIVKIPVIVKSKKLQPMDTALVNDKWEYLTPKLIGDLVNGNPALGEPISNQDAVDFYSQPIQNQAPYGQHERDFRHVTASVISKAGKAKLAKAVLSDGAIKQACVNNAAFHNVIKAVLSDNASDKQRIKSAYITSSEYTGGRLLITRQDGRREKLSMSHADTQDFVRSNFSQDDYTTLIKTGSLSFLSDDGGSFGMSGPQGIGGLLKKLMRKISGPGMFSMMGPGGNKPVLVIKIKRTAKPFSLNGKQLSEDFFGGDLIGLSEGGEMHELNNAEALPCDSGPESIIDSLSSVSADGLAEQDEVIPSSNGELLEPITVSRVVELPIGKAVIGETKQSRDVFVGLILNKLENIKTAQSYEALLPKGAAPVILSKNTEFIKVASAKPGQFYDLKDCVAAACVGTDMAEIRKLHDNSIAIKTASETITCPEVHAAYYLNSLGLSKSETVKIAKQLKSVNKAFIAMPKVASVKLSKALKTKLKDTSWLKIATFMESEESVDSALALDYLDDETMSEFYDKVPEYKNTLSELAKLLVSVRLGNDMATETVVKAAIESLSDLINELTENRAGG